MTTLGGFAQPSCDYNNRVLQGAGTCCRHRLPSLPAWQLTAYYMCQLCIQRSVPLQVTGLRIAFWRLKAPLLTLSYALTVDQRSHLLGQQKVSKAAKAPQLQFCLTI